jgi:hypothetical protein
MNASALSQVILISSTKNALFESMAALYTSYGLFKSLSTIYATIFMSTALLGCFLNILTICVLHVDKAHTPLFFYLKEITIISLLLKIMQFPFSLVKSRHYLSLGNSYAAQAYISYCYKPIINTFGFYKFVLNAHLTLDRIVMMRPRLNTWFSESPRLACSLTFLLTVLLMSPHYLTYSPARYLIRRSDLYDASQDFTYSEFHVTEASGFAQTRQGVIILNVEAAFRSVTMCLIDAFLNGFTIYYFKLFLSNKNKMTNLAYNWKPAPKTSKAQGILEQVELQTNSSNKSDDKKLVP